MNKLNVSVACSRGLAKLLTWLTHPVDGGTITSIAGGFSGVQAGISATPEDRETTVMRSEHSRVGKSRFGEQQRLEGKRTIRKLKRNK